MPAPAALTVGGGRISRAAPLAEDLVYGETQAGPRWAEQDNGKAEGMSPLRSFRLSSRSYAPPVSIKTTP